jgi:hypothetical protein
VSAAGRYEPFDYRRLWSLWEMLGKHAWEFFLLSAFLEWTCQRLGVKPPTVIPPLEGGGMMPLSALGTSLVSAYLAPALPPNPLASPSTEWLDDDEQKEVSGLLALVNHACNKIGILNVTKEVDRLKNSLKYKKKKRLSSVLSI